MELELPLRVTTPASWTHLALAEPLNLLNDHAYLEKKAASNAMELLNRWPAPRQPKRWVSILAGISRDETAHLAQVVRLLGRKGGELSRTHSNPYATALHKHIRKGLGTGELLDRLLISALIEARSCERFSLLEENTDDLDLRRLYRGLGQSELGHFKVFLILGNEVMPEKEVNLRWNEWLEIEKEIIQAQAPGPRMHSGWIV